MKRNRNYPKPGQDSQDLSLTHFLPDSSKPQLLRCGRWKIPSPFSEMINREYFHAKGKQNRSFAHFADLFIVAYKRLTNAKDLIYPVS